MNDFICCLLAYSTRKREHDAFRQGIALRSVQIGAHTVCANFQPLEKCREERNQFAGRHRELGYSVPFDLPRSAIPLMVMDEAFR